MEISGGRKLMLVISILFILTNCDKTFEIFLEGNNTKTVPFNCGLVNLNGSSIGKRQFVIIQDYRLEKGITIHKDSLEINYKGQSIPFTLEYESHEIQQSVLKINQSSAVLLRFYIPGGVETGDTIKLIPNGYLYCDQRKVGFGKIHLTVK